MTTEHPAAPPVLSLGVKLGGTDSNADAWRLAIMTLAQEIIRARDGWPDSAVRLNVVFHVDGDMAPLRFDEVRRARFSPNDRHLMVQVPVRGPCPSQPRPWLMTQLGLAVEIAENFARKRALADGLGELRQLLELLDRA